VEVTHDQIEIWRVLLHYAEFTRGERIADKSILPKDPAVSNVGAVSRGFRRPEIRQVEDLIVQRKDLLLGAWHEYFGS
jgi:hypothetical protein